MLDKEIVDTIKSWVESEDVGGFNQWLDNMQSQLKGVYGEHGLTPFEGMMLFVQIQSLYKLAMIRDKLQEIIDHDIGRGDTPT